MRMLTFIVSLCLSLQLVAQDSLDFTKLDQFFDLLESNNKFMGSVAAYKGDQVIYERYCGFSDVENHLSIDSLTSFRIGSITKMFTSVLIFREIEKGNLTLNTRLNHFFPEITNADSITISQLLKHRSGIHNFTDDIDYQGYMTMDKSRKDLLEIIQSKGSGFKPGEKMQYSNSNYVLLTFILEDITHKSYAQLVNELCDNLGLKHTRMGEKIDPTQNEALSYRYDQKWVPATETSMTIPLGAGSIVSTPRDLNLFIQKLFNGQVISKESFKKMTDLTESVGHGIFAFPFYDKTILGHNGGIDGFRSNLSINEDVSLAVLGNAYNYNLNEILIACLSGIYNRDFNLPDFSAKETQISSDVLKSLEGTYATTQMPLKIWIVYNGKQLTAQATGQSPFPLTAYENGIFKFEAAGVEIVFDMENNTIVPGKFQLKQNGMTFDYQRE